MNLTDPIANLCRRQWIEACGFAKFEPQALLDAVVVEVGRGTPPILVIDLDSTLYQVAPRTQAILNDATSHLREQLDERWISALTSIETHRIGYSLDETLSDVFSSEWETELCRTRFDSLHSFWWDRFFSDNYLEFDRPYIEAVEMMVDLHRLGAHLVYLTGREEKRMAVGTRRCLKRDGFPIDLSRTELILKPSKELDDALFKAEIARGLSERAPVLASFENEPRNFAAIHAALPQAQHVFVDTVCSLRPAPICIGGYLWKPDGF